MENYGILFWMNKNAFYRCWRRELMWNGWGGKKRKKTQNQLFNWWVKKHLLVIPLCDPASFLLGGDWGWEWNIGWQKTGWRVGWGQGQTDGPIFHCSFSAFSTLHTQKMWDYNYGLKELQCTCLQEASKWKLQLLKKNMYRNEDVVIIWIFPLFSDSSFPLLYCHVRKHWGDTGPIPV